MPGNEVGQQPIGTRIHVIGNSCSGKSTVANRLSQLLDAAFVELDALNWEPDWNGLNASDPAELERRIRAATEGERWVVAGSYTAFSQRTFWDRLHTVIWLDLPMPRLLLRVIRRSWRRSRSKELLWGTNYERFWPHFMVWRKEESLIWWIVTQHRRKRRAMLGYMSAPRWAHIRFIRLTSSAEIDDFVRRIEQVAGTCGEAERAAYRLAGNVTEA